MGYGIPLMKTEEWQEPLLMVAVSLADNNKMLDFLFDNGVNVFERDDFDVSPIMVAAYLGNKMAVQWFLKHGLNGNEIDATGATVRDYALRGKKEQNLIYSDSSFGDWDGVLLIL